MKVSQHLQNANGKPLISFEVLPPLKGKSFQSIADVLDPLMEFKPPFINVTYHRAETQFKKLVDGRFEEVAVRKRPGTVGICAAIMNRYKVDAVPHLICGGFTVEETEDALIDLDFLGVENILCLRGDAMKGQHNFYPEKGGHPHAIDLLKQAVNMNRGIYLEESQDAWKTNFCLGVAGYPEKHGESPNADMDFKYLKEKADAGADFIMTQMFFDNQKYFDFVNNCRAAGINIPIIPGLKPLTTYRQLLTLPKAFSIDLPVDLVNAIEKVKGNEEAIMQVGIEWCTAQSKELLANGAPIIHYYTMSSVKAVKQIAAQVF